jgi:hypothetical protein
MAADASWFGFVPYRTPEAILQLGVFQSQELVVYDSADGRSGDWWCQNHFGGNFGGHWTCTAADGLPCDQTLPEGATVTCAPQYATYQPRSAVIRVEDDLGRTAQQWCDQLEPEGGTLWLCAAGRSGSCSESQVLGATVNCVSNRVSSLHFVDQQSVAVYDVKPGQTGAWWCDHHFGANLGGGWFCLEATSRDCRADSQLGDQVVCGRLGLRQ